MQDSRPYPSKPSCMRITSRSRHLAVCGLLTIGLWAASVANATPGFMKTVAGGGRSEADGVVATTASLDYPKDVANAPDGGFYLADSGHHLIRRVDPSGIITTVAGSGTLVGSTGDGGSPLQAGIGSPYSIALAPDGTLYISDVYNFHIRAVSPGADGVVNGGPDEVITNFAGDGYKLAGWWGRATGDGGPATSASLDHPVGLTVSSAGEVFVADSWNHRIRKIDTQGVITTVAGDGWMTPDLHRGRYAGDGGPATRASLYLPDRIIFDSFGNLFISDRENSRVRRVATGADGVIDGDPDEIITTVAGGGPVEGFRKNPADTVLEVPPRCDGLPATWASLNYPRGLGFDAKGNLYIADAANYNLRKVLVGQDGVIDGDLDEIIITVAGNYLPPQWVQLAPDDAPAHIPTLLGMGGISVRPNGDVLIANAGLGTIKLVEGLPF